MIKDIEVQMEDGGVVMRLFNVDYHKEEKLFRKIDNRHIYLIDEEKVEIQNNGWGVVRLKDVELVRRTMNW